VRPAARRGLAASLVSVALGMLTLATVSCGGHETLPEGPLVYTGITNSWAGPVAVSQPRAWGLIRFGRDGLTARVERIRFETPIPGGVHGIVRINFGDQVPIGATKPPAGARLRGLPTAVRSPAQVVVWMRVDRPDLRYASEGVVIDYSVRGKRYRTTYPVGVTICSVRVVTRASQCSP